jgi:hypothetical protein
MSQVSHKLPESLKRLAKGAYEVKGTALTIEQGTDGKWRIEGHSDDLGAFKNRQGALDKLQELHLVPEVQPEPAKQPVQAEADKQPVEEVKAETPDPTPAKRTRKAKATATA